MLQALAALVSSDAHLRVVATATDGELALNAVRRLQPEMLILDVRMAIMDGMTCLRQLRAEGHVTRVLMFSALEDTDSLRGMIEAGADGVALKTDLPHVVLSAIQQVAAGQLALPQSARRYLFGIPSTATPPNPLTDRESEILKLLSKGHSNTQIATTLSLSENTVKFHLRNVYAKLEVTNRTEAAARFHQRV